MSAHLLIAVLDGAERRTAPEDDREDVPADLSEALAPEAPDPDPALAGAPTPAPGAPLPAFLFRLEPDDGRDAVEGEGDAALRAVLDTAGLERDGLRIDLVLAGSGGHLVPLTLPPRSQRRLGQVLPFLVEEFVTEDIERFHLVPGPVRGQRVRVAAWEHVPLADWIARFTAAGLEPDAVRPLVTLLCDDEEDVVAVAHLAGRDHLIGPGGGLCADPEWRGLALEGLFGGGTVRALRLLGLPPDDPELTAAAVAHDAVLEPVEAGVLEHLAQRCRAGAGIDLRTGPHAVRRRRRTGRTSARMGLVALLLLWFGLETGLAFAEGLWLGQRASGQREQAEALYRELFPEARRVTNPVRQMRQQLQAGSAAGDGGADFLDLLGALATQARGLEWVSVTFSEARGELTVELRVPDLARLEAIKTRLDAEGLTAEIVSAVQGDRAFAARLRIRGAEA